MTEKFDKEAQSWDASDLRQALAYNIFKAIEKEHRDFDIFLLSAKKPF